MSTLEEREFDERSDLAPQRTRAPLVVRIYQAFSWLPLAALLVGIWEIKRHEGWGAWAVAAGIMPVLLGFSAIMGSIGIVLMFFEWRKGRWSFVLLLATLLASSVSLWFLSKVLLREMTFSQVVTGHAQTVSPAPPISSVCFLPKGDSRIAHVFKGEDSGTKTSRPDEGTAE